METIILYPLLKIVAVVAGIVILLLAKGGLKSGGSFNID